MDRHDLENTLQQMAARPRPELSPAFEQNVWRTIRRRKAGRASEPGWLFLRPAWAVAAVAVVTISMSIATVLTEATASPAAATHSSLGLGVFSAEAPVLPSTLMLERAR